MINKTRRQHGNGVKFSIKSLSKIQETTECLRDKWKFFCFPRRNEEKKRKIVQIFFSPIFTDEKKKLI